jgi:arylsulfatase
MELHYERPTRYAWTCFILPGALLWACLPARPLWAEDASRGERSAATLDRTVLPVPEPTPSPITQIDARKALAPPRFEVRAPKGPPTC